MSFIISTSVLSVLNVWWMACFTIFQRLRTVGIWLGGQLYQVVFAYILIRCVVQQPQFCLKFESFPSCVDRGNKLGFENVCIEVISFFRTLLAVISVSHNVEIWASIVSSNSSLSSILDMLCSTTFLRMERIPLGTLWYASQRINLVRFYHYAQLLQSQQISYSLHFAGK